MFPRSEDLLATQLTATQCRPRCHRANCVARPRLPLRNCARPQNAWAAPGVGRDCPAGGSQRQNANFRPACMTRGGIAPMLVILPKFPSPTVLSGLEKLGVLRALNISQRNWRL